jgi:hypothetical protein
MSQSIDWNISARASGGPLLTGAGSAVVDAYDRITVTVAAAATQVVNVAPAKWDSVSFLALIPAKADPKLTYNNGATDIVLDGPHFLIGAGAVSLLGTGNATLTIKNGTAADATIDILVGRDATP